MADFFCTFSDHNLINLLQVYDIIAIEHNLVMYNTDDPEKAKKSFVRVLFLQAYKV